MVILFFLWDYEFSVGRSYVLHNSDLGVCSVSRCSISSYWMNTQVGKKKKAFSFSLCHCLVYMGWDLLIILRQKHKWISIFQVKAHRKLVQPKTKTSSSLCLVMYRARWVQVTHTAPPLSSPSLFWLSFVGRYILFFTTLDSLLSRMQVSRDGEKTILKINVFKLHKFSPSCTFPLFALGVEVEIVHSAHETGLHIDDARPQLAWEMCYHGKQ